MPNSIASSEPLSSPSPSPPPAALPSLKSHPGAGLDSDGSELSELTDDEQDSEKRGSGSQDEDSRSSRRSGKKKRGSLVPAPMWDWAYKAKKGEDRGEMVEEEEEEDDRLSRKDGGFPRAMEEEEGEEDSHKGHSAGESEGRHREMKRSGSSQEVQVIAPDDARVDSPEPADAEMDDAPSGSERYGSDRGDNDDVESDVDVEDDHDSIKSSRPETKENTPELTEDEQEGAADNEEEEEEEDDGPVSPRPSAPTRVEEEEEVESEDAESEDEPDEPPQPDDQDLKDEPEPDAPPIPVKRATSPVMASMNPNEDITAPDPATVIPIQEKAAALSIMAGASVIHQPSPTPSGSAPSSVSTSPSSSRSASPDPGAGNHRKRKKRRAEPGTEKTNSAGGVSGPSDAKNHDADAEEGDKEAGDGENDVEADVDGDVDDIEVDEPEIESELQPAHRAEALEVLATIEIKVALLREKLYMEKMKGLAWEEALIIDDTHPELLHLQAELSKRRDRRLDLAAKRRSYEVTMVTKKRKADEDGVWSWWKFSVDELQTDMISDTNRKRRRLERARRASERPQPMRRIPDPPVNVPPAPTLREIVRSTPFANFPDSSAHGHSHKRDVANGRPLVYPQLSSLSSAEVVNDLDLIWQQRRRHIDPRMNSSMGPPLSHGYEPGYGPIDNGHYNVPGSSRMPPPFQPLIQGYPGPSVPSRMQHHHPGPSGLHQSHIPVDQDVAMSSGVPPPSNSYAQGPVTGMSRSLSPVHVTSNGASGLGPSQNGWLAGSGRGKPPPAHGEWMKESRRSKDEYERDRERDKARERNDRERERERELEWERERERERYQMMQSQPVRPSHSFHPGPGQVPHPGPHNHHHHHHHIHHHHHPASMGGPGGHSSTLSPSGGTPGSSGTASSPRVAVLSRDFDSGRPHSGPPTTEVINLSSSSSKRSPNTFWKTEELEIGRDRVRPPSSQHPLDDRPVHSIMTPVQLMSSHGPPGHAPSAPASMAPSPRGPWSAADDIGMRRPSSATMGHQSSLSGRSSPGPLHGSAHGMRGAPPLQPSRQPSMVMSSPRTHKPPPTSPVPSSSSFPGPLRSPTRSAHTLPLPSSASGPASLSSATSQLPSHPSLLSSSSASRPNRPPSPPLLSKMIHSGGPSGPSPPLAGPARPMSPVPRSVNSETHMGRSPPFNGASRTATPLSLFSGHSAPPSRLTSDQSSPQLNNAPPQKMNVVQLVDGS